MAAALLLLVGGSVVRANPCIDDARNTYGECKGQCKDDFNDARALCRNIDPGCFGACVDGRAECIDTAREPLTTCLDGCQATLHQHRLDCKASSGCGGTTDPCSSNPAFIACMDPFQLDAFVCRDTCRDSFRLNLVAQAALKACNNGFRACRNSCPSLP